ncbi:MAG: ImmA/IrrE family metallo-endopeptidase [Lachnospiraceae bacterium]|nr:ImmA/IrrE family metallo-endopeptidase [Lachnospiraceae bacterium]
MRLESETYELIKQFVADMYVQCNITRVPIDVFDVATKLGLNVVPYSKMEEKKELQAWSYDRDGFLLLDDRENGTIYYNDIAKAKTRINQTIMHEIGHFLLGHKSNKPNEREEAEAKFFAKYSLAPMPLIHFLVGKKTTDNLRERFGIGYKAADIALENYASWLSCAEHDFTTSELEILKQFGLPGN